MENGFITALITSKVKLHPALVTKQFQGHLLQKLRHTFEGKCTQHGYIKPKSIDIVKVSCGLIKDVTLNGDTLYHVSFNAEICNPVIGSILSAKVINTNMFGILAESGLNIDGKFYPIVEIIVAKNNGTTNVNLDKINVGDNINVEVMGKKYELNDTKITVIGKVVNTQPHKSKRGDNAEKFIENDVDEEENEDEVIDLEEEEEEDDTTDKSSTVDSIESFAESDDGGDDNDDTHSVTSNVSD